MRDLRNHTRQVVERAQSEPVTITDSGTPIAVLTALVPNHSGWDADAWLNRITGPDWESYDSGLAADIEADRRADDEPDAADLLGLV